MASTSSSKTKTSSKEGGVVDGPRAIRKEVRVLWSSGSRKRKAMSTDSSSAATTTTIRIEPVFYPFEMLFEGNDGDDDPAAEGREGMEKSRRLDFSSPSDGTIPAALNGLPISPQPSSTRQSTSTSKKQKSVREILQEIDAAPTANGVTMSIPGPRSSENVFGIAPRSSERTGSGPQSASSVVASPSTTTALSFWALSGGPPDFRPPMQPSPEAVKIDPGAINLAKRNDSNSKRVQVIREELKLMDHLKQEVDASKRFEARLKDLLKQ